MAEGKDQREQRVGASPANQQPIWVWAWCWGSHTPWNFPSDIGSGEDAFLCGLQPIPSRGRESRVTGGGGMQKGETGFSGALWSGGTPLPQLLDKGWKETVGREPYKPLACFLGGFSFSFFYSFHLFFPFSLYFKIFF